MTAYDRNSTGPDLTTCTGQPWRPRPEPERVRCGSYTHNGQTFWGDHRVTMPGTTCVEVDCHVPHHPGIPPGWAEPMAGFYDRPGVAAIAAALWGWDCAGILQPLGDTSAWNAAHVVLDALRDAGYTITPPPATGS